jgi:hypothetical protein
MRNLVLAAPVLLSAALSPLPALATALGPPAATYIFGTIDAPFVSVTQGDETFTCQLVDTMASSEMRSTGAGAVTFSMSETVQYYNNVDLYTYGSYVMMTFATASTGTIKFLQEIVDPAGATSITHSFQFVAYTQKYYASTKYLVLSFTIDFPNCPLVVSAAYQQ